MAGPGQSDASATSVQANYGVAAGGDILNNSIQISHGLDEQKIGLLLDEKFARLTDQIAQDKGVAVAPLRAVLVKLGEANVADEQIPERLSAKADELIDLRARWVQLREDRPELADIRTQAQELINQGGLDQARAVLDAAREAQRTLREKAIEKANRDEAELLADEARLDHLQLAYRDAAAKYSEAAALITPHDPRSGRQYMMSQAKELWDQGYEFGDNVALSEAIDIYKRALDLVPVSAFPLLWAATQQDLGVALAVLGQRESGADRLRRQSPPFARRSQFKTGRACLTFGLEH